MSPAAVDAWQTVHEAITNTGRRCVGAESCTGGSVAGAITMIPGASAWFWGAVVVYDNAAKTAMLGVDPASLSSHGAVSAPVVREMLAGLEPLCPGALRYAVSGIAGPGGGSPQKPVGLVFLGVALGEYLVIEEQHFAGDRNAVREQASIRLAHLAFQSLTAVKNCTI